MSLALFEGCGGALPGETAPHVKRLKTGTSWFYCRILPDLLQNLHRRPDISQPVSRYRHSCQLTDRLTIHRPTKTPDGLSGWHEAGLRMIRTLWWPGQQIGVTPAFPKSFSGKHDKYFFCQMGAQTVISPRQHTIQPEPDLVRSHQPVRAKQFNMNLGLAVCDIGRII